MRGLAALALLAAADAAACPGLELSDGWIREAPPGATVMAGYARLHNAGTAPMVLDKVSSPAFGAAELHRTLVANGVSRMLRSQTLGLAPGDRASLQPGGWHLMLFRPQAPLKAGDTVRIALGCGAETVTFPFTVRRE